MEQGTTKINLAVESLPQFRCCNLSHPDAGPQHVGTIHIGSERYAFNRHASFSLFPSRPIGHIMENPIGHIVEKIVE